VGGRTDVAHRVADVFLVQARDAFVANVRGLSLEEALDAAGGFRSILGLMKHTAGWSAVYHSYAFDEPPRHWDAVDWPRGLIERIEPTSEYVDEILTWFEGTADSWLTSVAATDLEEEHPLHWGERWPLREIVALVAGHWQYHAGEINALLAIQRGEAWEFGEEVEENHIATYGHGVRSEWMSDEYVEQQQARIRAVAED